MWEDSLHRTLRFISPKIRISTEFLRYLNTSSAKLQRSNPQLDTHPRLLHRCLMPSRASSSSLFLSFFLSSSLLQIPSLICTHVHTRAQKQTHTLYTSHTRCNFVSRSKEPIVHISLSHNIMIHTTLLLIT